MRETEERRMVQQTYRFYPPSAVALCDMTELRHSGEKRGRNTSEKLLASVAALNDDDVERRSSVELSGAQRDVDVVR